jgi:hypothetical protein
MRDSNVSTFSGLDTGKKYLDVPLFAAAMVNRSNTELSKAAFGS